VQHIGKWFLPISRQIFLWFSTLISFNSPLFQIKPCIKRSFLILTRLEFQIWWREILGFSTREGCAGFPVEPFPIENFPGSCRISLCFWASPICGNSWEQVERPVVDDWLIVSGAEDAYFSRGRCKCEWTEGGVSFSWVSFNYGVTHGEGVRWLDWAIGPMSRP